MRLGRSHLATVFAGVALLLPACASPPMDTDGFDSAYPEARLYAIEKAAREDDRTKIPALIRCLDSDDPAVRMLAITTLARMNKGETLGYNYADPPGPRGRAVEKWVRWVADHPQG